MVLLTDSALVAKVLHDYDFQLHFLMSLQLQFWPLELCIRCASDVFVADPGIFRIFFCEVRFLYSELGF